MKTVISGSWKTTNKQVEKDIKKEIKKILSDSKNIILAGGALGVDFIATNEVLKYDPKALKLQIILPTSLDIYVNHYQKKVEEKVITKNQARQLINQLKKIKKINPKALKELNNKKVEQKSYYQRNSALIKEADKLAAFQVNNSLGTQDTIDKAKEKNIPVVIYKYKINI